MISKRNCILSVLSLYLFMGCSIYDPEIPGWESNIKVHFRTDKIEMKEVLTDSTFSEGYSSQYGDTLIYVSIADTTEPETIKRDDMAFKADNDRVSETVGIIELEDPDPVRTDPTTLNDIVPEFDLQPGFELPPISPRTVTPPSHSVTFTRFEVVQIDTAYMYLVFYNNLILDIDSGLKIRIFDAAKSNNADRGIIDSVTFNEPIPVGESAKSTPVDLAGKTISNQVLLEYVVPIAGTDQSIVLTQEDINSNFQVEVLIENLKVIHAIADVKEQTIEKNGATNIDTENKEVNFAELDECKLNLEIENHMQLDTDMQVRILNVIDEFQQPKEVSIFMPAMQTTYKTVDISGYAIHNHLHPGQAVDSIRYEITAVTQPSNGLVTIDSEDSIVVNVTMDSAYVSYFEGSVSNLDIDITPVEENNLVDFSKFEGTFRLPDLILTLNFYNQINFDMNLAMQITGKNEKSGETVTLNVDALINKGTVDEPGKTVIQLDRNSSNPSIVDLMAILPSSIEMSGNGFIDGQGSVNLSDQVWADYSIDSPLKAVIDEPVFIKTDLDSITMDDLNKDDRKRITQDVRNISVFINSLNGLPLGTDFTFAISSDSTNLFDDQSADSTRIVLSTTIFSGEKNSDGLVIQPKSSSDELLLTPAQLQLFNKSPLYYRGQVRVRPQTEPVLFRKNDVFTYDGYLDIKAKVDVENE